MNDDLEAIDGLCAKIIEQRDRIWKLEAALREILVSCEENEMNPLADSHGDIARAALDPSSPPKATPEIGTEIMLSGDFEITRE